MNDFTISCVYEYLNRITGEAETDLRLLHQRLDLRKADTVDIIDLIEKRIRYETLCEVEHSLFQIISWGRIFGSSN